ncbi:hypothetical protein CE91St41_32840 [Oscillospiraceae bacterium]|nr:hypothetical protein CE91St40_32830 [Oscillospiraceae bacterium]BDF76395.1 hypothetical protein CE91St41_32840 [Oscillospiraceae bacterium]
MSRICKYYGRPVVSRSGMEEVRDTLGTVTVSPASVRAGQYQTYRITYTVGREAIQTGGVIRFSIPFGFAAPQAELPIRPGYVRAETDKPGVNLSLEFRKNVWHRKSFTRTKQENNTEHTGANVYVRVTGGALRAGDQVRLIYGDDSYGADGAYAPNTLGPLQFDVAVDPDGNGAAPFSGFSLCSSVPFVNVLPLEACRLNVIIPSNTVAGQPFKVILAALDRFQNLAFDYEGLVELYCGEEKLGSVRFDREDGGLRNAAVTLSAPCTAYLRALDGQRGFSALSNPTLCTSEPSGTKFYWGDIHGHTAIQWGQGSGEGYYEYGKEVAGLDFCCLSDPGAGRYTDDDATCRDALSCYMTDGEWEQIRQINRRFYQPGVFVPLLGYEYHNDAPGPQYGGDRNVYYADYDAPLFRCCDEGSYTPEQLWKRLEEHQLRAITIPHHTAKSVMLNNLSLHNEHFQRLIEIYSSWGSSECEGCERPIIGGSDYKGHCVQDALARGHRLGFVGASDTHSGQPGFTYWVFENRSYRGGLTCVMTDELDREHVFNAMWERSVYATTGERILLWFRLNGAPMGRELRLKRGAPLTLEVKAIGTGEVDCIEIIRDGGVICRRACEGGRELSVTFEDNSGVCNGTWSYYYARVMQKDKAMAWASPIWVVYED